MGEQTKIPWCDHTFNPWWGCTKISSGCDHCYAERLAVRYGFQLWGLDAPRRIMSKKQWDEPRRWNAAAEKAGQRKRVFCGSMCDVFEEVPTAELDEPRERLWMLIDDTPWLDWLLLTKRPENVLDIVPAWYRMCWPQNVWMLTTIENHDVMIERMDALLKIPAPIRGVSAEPLLGRVNLALVNWCQRGRDAHGIDWVIVGAESGPRRRPCHLCEVHAIVDDCFDSGVACFVKQLDIDGRLETDPDRWPEWARVQEFPTT